MCVQNYRSSYLVLEHVLYLKINLGPSILNCSYFEVLVDFKKHAPQDNL